MLRGDIRKSPLTSLLVHFLVLEMLVFRFFDQIPPTLLHFLNCPNCFWMFLIQLGRDSFPGMSLQGPCHCVAELFEYNALMVFY